MIYELLFDEVDIIGVNQDIVDEVTINMPLSFSSEPAGQDNFKINIKIEEENLGYLTYFYYLALKDLILSSPGRLLFKINSIYRVQEGVGIKINIYKTDTDHEYDGYQDYLERISWCES